MAEEEVHKELEEIKKLPPTQRLQRLREIAERQHRRRKEAQEEITEAEKLIEETEIELQRSPVTEAEAGELGAVVSEEEGLEEIAEEAPREEGARIEYLRQLDYRALGLQFEYLTSTLQESGSLTEGQATDLYSVVQEARTRRKAIEEGTYKPTGEKISEQFTEIESTWEKIRKYIR